jgi:cytochrome c-type biogenesis protein CcsB
MDGDKMKSSRIGIFLAAMALSSLVGWLIWNQGAFRIAPISYESLRPVLVLNEGRITPFDTYARKFALTLTGSETPKLKEFSASLQKDLNRDKISSKMNAMEFLLLLISRDDPLVEKVLRIDHPELKKMLGIDPDRKFIAFQDAAGSPVLDELRRAYHHKQEEKIPLSSLDEAFIELNTQVNMLSELVQGSSLSFYPKNSDRYTDWAGVTSLEGSSDPDAEKVFQSFQKMLHANYFANHPQKKDVKVPGISTADMDHQENFDEAVTAISKVQRNRYSSDPSIFSKAPQELIYNRVKPFRIAWIIYLISLIAGVLGLLFALEYLGTLSSSLMILGFLSHTFGLGLRVLILDRPPVGNMYESVVFVGWCVVFFFLLILGKQKSHFLQNTAVLSASLIMIMADLLPMSQELGMLEAVLRSNYWLTIHVLTIVASYGAFALACGIGHYYLYLLLTGAPGHTTAMKGLADSVYQSIKVGVILIGAGTILGGVWANESWGRFWGWDPKETWALISFLGYLALLHGKKANWFGDFGIAVGSLIGFLLILMTWYGVNFVLGIGLHSYGFGSGGTHYALGFVLAELTFLTAVYLRRPTATS